MSKEIIIDTKKKNVEDFVDFNKKFAPGGFYFFKCKCGIFTTDYPFVAECSKCGYKYAGTKEDIEKWKKEGIFMELLDPKEIPTKTKEDLITEYEESVYNGDYDDYKDIMGF